MFQNSIGNITEILHLLDSEIYSGEEITEHYKMLVEKWGEWEIIGADSSGLVVRYVDIRNALFSGMMILYAFLAGLSFVLAIIGLLLASALIINRFSGKVYLNEKQIFIANIILLILLVFVVATIFVVVGVFAGKFVVLSY